MKKKILMTLVSVVALMAIATPFYIANHFEIPAISMSEWRKLEVGTSKEQVKKIFGRPIRISNFSDGSEWWYYKKWYSVAEACVTFDEEGNMTGGTHDWD